MKYPPHLPLQTIYRSEIPFTGFASTTVSTGPFMGTGTGSSFKMQSRTCPNTSSGGTILYSKFLLPYITPPFRLYRGVH